MEFDIHQFDQYREGNRLEVKKARKGIPQTLWETYSSFANTDGGMILLGVGESEDHSFFTTGIEDPHKAIKDFWDTLNNRQKVSINILVNSDIKEYEVNGDTVIAIHVPRAAREDKPVYINDDLFGGTYRRNGEGDYHCSKAEIKAMLRDQVEETSDMKILEERELSDFNQETVQSYRSRHEAVHPEHVWSRLSDEEYLENIGAVRRSSRDHKLHPTGAGLLMFGNEYKILYEYPEYFLDYREVLDPTIRWTDRLQSGSGDWSGNLFDFYFRVINKLTRDLKIPFQMQGISRIEDTSVHKAMREALANCLVNADFYLPRGVVILKDAEKIVMENPGYIRTGKTQMLKGGVSDPRNKGLMKMFNLIAIGERAGSGVPDIFSVWDEQGWKTPVVEEQFNPDRTILTLPLTEKQSDKNNQIKQADSDKNKRIKKQADSSKKPINKGKNVKQSDNGNQIKQSDTDKNNQIKQSDKTSENKEKIQEYLRTQGSSKAAEIAEVVGLSYSRTRALLWELIKEKKVEAVGEARARVYKISDQ